MKIYSDGKFIWGDVVITPTNEKGLVVEVDGKHYKVEVNGKVYSYIEEELVYANF